APFRRKIGVGHRRDVNGLSRHFGGLLPGHFHGVGLRLKPLAPVLARPAVLRQERGITVDAAERTADKRVASPVEAASENEAGRGAEYRTGVNLFHSQIPPLAEHRFPSQILRLLPSLFSTKNGERRSEPEISSSCGFDPCQGPPGAAQYRSFSRLPECHQPGSHRP